LINRIGLVVKDKAVKQGLHSRNQHKGIYDFERLTRSTPELKQFLLINSYQNKSIDFANPKAVTALNKAILQDQYELDYWDIPSDYLCPPIPGRADYIHHMADLLAKDNQTKIPTGKSLKCLDIGVGANCIYPIVGRKEYGWAFIGSDIDTTALNAAQNIIDKNAILSQHVELRHQPRSSQYFKGIIKKKEKFDLTVCNPPFHASKAAANKGSIRKVRNLTKSNVKKPVLNFGGKSTELWCKGGEKQFIGDMIYESKSIALNCLWFTSLVSKENNLKSVYAALKRANATAVRTIHMGQGNKVSRVVAWTFHDKSQRENWFRNKFK